MGGLVGLQKARLSDPGTAPSFSKRKGLLSPQRKNFGARDLARVAGPLPGSRHRARAKSGPLYPPWAFRPAGLRLLACFPRAVPGPFLLETFPFFQEKQRAGGRGGARGGEREPGAPLAEEARARFVAFSAGIASGKSAQFGDQEEPLAPPNARVKERRPTGPRQNSKPPAGDLGMGPALCFWRCKARTFPQPQKLTPKKRVWWLWAPFNAHGEGRPTEQTRAC